MAFVSVSYSSIMKHNAKFKDPKQIKLDITRSHWNMSTALNAAEVANALRFPETLQDGSAGPNAIPTGFVQSV